MITELILSVVGTGGMCVTYGIGRIHGREAGQRSASRFADWKIQQYGAETTYEQTKRESQERVAKKALAASHGHPDAFCSPATNCYGKH